MIPKANRLKRKRDFEILFEQGRFVGDSLVTAKVWKIDPTAYPKRGYTVDDLKIGFVVPKKVSKSAVKRNRLKRQMREVVRLMIKEEKLHVGFMLSIIGKPAMLDASYTDIEKSITQLLQKARVLR